MWLVAYEIVPLSVSLYPCCTKTCSTLPLMDDALAALWWEVVMCDFILDVDVSITKAVSYVALIYQCIVRIMGVSFLVSIFL